MFLAILLLGFFITKPFLPALFTGAIIAYLSYPLYKKLLAHIKNKNFASFIIAFFIVLIFAIPFIVVLGLVSKEAYLTYTTLNQQDLGTNFLRVVCKDESWMSCKAVKSLVDFLPRKDLDYYLQVTIGKITIFIIENVSRFLSSIPLILLNFFVMIFVVYYLLKDGEIMAERLKKILPLKESHKQHVLQTFHNTTYAVFYGNILTAVLQGILGVIGFLALGIQSAILWGFVMMVFALIPYFGTAIIWLPAALNLIFIGYLQNDNSSTIRGVILIVYGIFVVSSIDNFLKPKMISAKAKVHPILALIGVLGGLSLFGFLGLILGPVMLALLMTFVDIYEDEKTEIEKYF
ncbi:AI-2E family transporter [Candidatus Woesearchaeota archaeon]|nr:AI-2E family transporter [Candidatus Woesearchaeota archaeon]